MKQIFIIHLFIFGIFAISCQKSPIIDAVDEEHMMLTDQIMPADFDYSVKTTISFFVSATTNMGMPLENVLFNVFDGIPNEGGKKLFSGITNESGQFEREHDIASALTQVVITTDYIGLVNSVVVPVAGSYVHCDFNDLPIQPNQFSSSGNSNKNNSAGMGRWTTNDGFSFLGTYNNQGVPDYLEIVPDAIDQDFLNDVNASLPEQQPVPTNNPEYLANGNQINTLLLEPSDVWVTFVHEGAGYKNVLGFYSYPADSPPTTVAEIDSITIVFPNVSYSGSGGGLNSGDKVNIGHFPANTEIGWVLLANAWNGSVTNGYHQVYSESAFNPESDPLLQQHVVLLYDTARDLTVLGFEDLRRDGNCDNDFNDAIFYVTSNPATAIEYENVVPLTYVGDDADGDGVNDPVDAYPNDPTRAYNNYYPAQNIFGSLAFEDMWPNVGDYDFNDLIVDYTFTEIVNAQNNIVELEASFVVTAIGASYENGFGFEMPIAPGMVQSVTGSQISGNLINFEPSGVEAGQSNAVIIPFDNAYSILNRPPGYFVNTQDGAPYVTPDTITVSIAFTEPIDYLQFGTPPYNPFIIINQDRLKEVHLAGKPPTTIAMNSEYFDTGQDNSSVSGYYKTLNNLPWALDIVEPLDYPFEKVSIDLAYNYFVQWAESSGISFSDWYKNIVSYRVDQNIYNSN